MKNDDDQPSVILGTTTTVRTMADDVIARFFKKICVNVESGCHEWTAHCADNGYGKLQVAGKSRSVHRISWEIHRGVIPIGLFVLHRCDNRKCVNPAHLFLGTHADNMVDRNLKNRQWKPKGGLNPQFKVTSALKEKIKDEYLNSQDTIAAISKRFGVCEVIVARCGGNEKRGRAGARNGRAKLTPECAAQIRAMAIAGKSLNSISKEIGLSWPTVKRVVDGSSFV